MKTLTKKLSFECKWASYIACLKSISDYLDLGHSTPWIYGTSGYAFIMNIHKELCPSGPTAFSQEPINSLAANLGYDLYGTVFVKTDPGFKQKQKEAWEMTKLAIDNDLPTFGWELNIPEYYMIYGYDNENYLFYDLDGKPMKKKWDTLGETEIGVVSIFSGNPNNKEKSVNQILKETFEFTLKFAKKNKEWTFPLYENGLKAYEVWIDALQQDKYLLFGLAYNAQVWAECRANAFEFLKEAKQKLNTDILDNLIEHYDVISWSLQKVAKLFPMGIEKTDKESVETAIDSLFLAKEAEKAALAEMKHVLSQL